MNFMTHLFLKGLNVSHNRIVSLRHLANLVNLRDLNCRDNLVESVEGIPMESLVSLDISNNPVTDIDQLDDVDFKVTF